MAQSYDEVYNSLGAQYQPQVDLVNQQIAQLQPQQDAQQAALDQAKVNAFKDITNQSNARGVLFSGVPIENQSQYVGTKYLPAVANLKTSFQNTKNTLLGQINSAQASRSRQAQQTVAAQQQAEAQQAYRDQQAEAQRVYREQQLGLGYARLAASNARNTVKPLTQDQTSAAILQGLNGVRGGDGYVAPQDYAQAFKDWTTAGFAASQFNNRFGHLKNPKNGYYDYAISQVK